MSLRIHHLNCATLCVSGSRLIRGQGGWLETAQLVCHCLLVETNEGLVLVDTGLGLSDIREPRHLGAGFNMMMRPRLNVAETAVSQVKALGFSPDDVRHIVLTHMDLDHAGGLPDFPAAKVHIFAQEYQRAMARPSWHERSRYRPAQWAHGPQWQVYDEAGEDWFGFRSVRALGDSDGEILLVPLVGHTLGHAGIAVRSGDGWLLHCGDAYFHQNEVRVDDPSCPAGLKLFQRIVAMDNRARLDNQERLRHLAGSHGQEVRLICSHDTDDFHVCCGHG